VDALPQWLGTVVKTDIMTVTPLLLSHYKDTFL